MVDERSHPREESQEAAEVRLSLKDPALAQPGGLPCGRIDVEGIAVYTDCSRPRCPSLSENFSDGEGASLGDELVFSIPPLSGQKGSSIPSRSEGAPALQLISFDDITSLANAGRWPETEDGGYVPTASLPFAARLALADGTPSGLRLRGRRGCGVRAAPVAAPGRPQSAPRPTRTDQDDVPWAGFREFSPIPASIPMPRGDHAPRPPRIDDIPALPQLPPQPPHPLPSLCSFDEPSLQAGLTLSLPLASSPRVSQASSFMDRVPNERGGAAFGLPSSAIAATSIRATATAFRPKASVCHALDERALDDECHDDKEWFVRRPPRCSMLATLCGSTGCPSTHGANGVPPCDEMHTGIVWPPCGPVEQLRVRVRL